MRSGKEKSMSGLSVFLKENKKNTEHVKVVVSKAFADGEGNPVKWEMRPLKSKEADAIRDQCTTLSKGGIQKIDTARFNRMVTARCTIYPNLNDKELQDSYGVMGAEELIQELLDNDGEYQAYAKRCLEISGYYEKEEELVDQAKN